VLRHDEDVTMSDDDLGELERLLGVYRDTGDPKARDRAIELGIPLAERVAKRFAGRGESMEDLRQAALLGLVNAADRYETGHEGGFRPFAVATMLGELKRHFRDKTWALRVPRSVKEYWLTIRAATEALEKTGEPVTIARLAQETGLNEEQVLEGLEAGQARHLRSLDAPLSTHDDDSDMVLGDSVGQDQDALEATIEVAALAPAIAKLSDREKKLLELRFVHELTQKQIGAQLGVSQMQVSRLLQALCEKLRRSVLP
jgi:RNA polymerase sigma-B factor